MKILKKSIYVMLFATPAVFSTTIIEEILQVSDPDYAELSTTGISSDSPKSDTSLIDPIELEISATTTLASMLPYLAESSKRQIEGVIDLLHGSGSMKFRYAEAMLRACEIVPCEGVEVEEDMPKEIEQTSSQRDRHLLNRDVLHVIRSLEMYTRHMSDGAYDADGESSPGLSESSQSSNEE